MSIKCPSFVYRSYNIYDREIIFRVSANCVEYVEYTSCDFGNHFYGFIFNDFLIPFGEKIVSLFVSKVFRLLYRSGDLYFNS